MSASKDTGGKTSFFDLPLTMLGAVAKISAVGRKKYGLLNWPKGAPASRVFDSIFRHLLQWYYVQNVDPESRMTHLAHVAWWALAGLHYELGGTLDDDRLSLTDSEKQIILDLVYEKGSWKS